MVMADAAPAVPQPERPVRAWPVAALAIAYWAFLFALTQMDMIMFHRFMAKTIASALFLLVSWILWFTNGTVTGKVRLLGFGAFLGALGLGIALRDKSYDPFAFIMQSVPWMLTGWATWLVVGRYRPHAFSAVSLSVILLLSALVGDLFRWEGLDGRLRATLSLRWSATSEQQFLASKKASAAESPGASVTLRDGDFPDFRGARRDGVVRGVRVATNWKDARPEQVWKERVGPGWSGMIVVDGRLFTQEQRGESEAVVCYDAATGKERWAQTVPARFDEGIAGPGPRATPTYHQGRLYALGAAGMLSCLNAASGAVVWSRDLAKEASAPPPQWGFSASPLVVDGKAVVFIGGAKALGVIAVDAATGKPAWSREGGRESYSSAQLAVIRGKPQLLVQDNKRLAGLAVADGAVLWERAGEGENIIPMIQPHPLDDGLLLASQGMGMSLLELREDGGKWSVAEKWTSLKIKPSFNDVVVHDGHLYGLDDGILTCVELKTGERVWKRGRFGGGQVLLLADQGALIVLSEKGELAIVDAKPQDPGEIFRFPAIDGKTWNHPTVVQDRLFVRNGAEMACFRLTKTP